MADNKEKELLNKLSDLLTNQSKEVKITIDENTQKSDKVNNEPKIIPIPNIIKP